EEAATLLRRPGEARVHIENAVDLKSAKRLAEKIPAITEERDVPQSGKNQVVTNIKIRWTAVKSLIAGIALLFSSSERAGVDALGPPISGLHLKTAGIAARGAQQHRVVARIYVRQREEDAIEVWIAGQSRRDLRTVG